MNNDGTNVRKLTERRGGYLEPAWSPKGDKIAFIYDKPFFSLFGRHPGIYVVNLDGKTGMRLYKAESNDIENIGWDPKGKMLSFTEDLKATSTDGDGMITEEHVSYLTCITEVSTENEIETLAETMVEPSVPEWSFDGERITYTDNFSAYVAPVGASDDVSKFGVPYAIGTPKWGPTDKKVVCVGYEKLIGNDRALYVFDYRESKVYKLTDGESIVKHPAWMPRK